MSTLAIAASGVFMTVLGVAGPAVAAGVDIPYTWNSGDHDAKARFASAGDNFFAVEYEGNDYIDWSNSSIGSGRWYVPGSEDATRKGLNLEMPEGTTVKMQVCETKTAAPDDCSDWEPGRA
jgi:hypothetical protein